MDIQTYLHIPTRVHSVILEKRDNFTFSNNIITRLCVNSIINDKTIITCSFISSIIYYTLIIDLFKGNSRYHRNLQFESCTNTDDQLPL
jgi:hypothetical protein